MPRGRRVGKTINMMGRNLGRRVDRWMGRRTELYKTEPTGRCEYIEGGDVEMREAVWVPHDVVRRVPDSRRS